MSYILFFLSNSIVVKNSPRKINKQVFRGSNSNPYIYYSIFLPTKLNWRELYHMFYFIFYIFFYKERVKWHQTKRISIKLIPFSNLLSNAHKYYLKKEGKNTYKLGTHKPNRVKPHKSVIWPQTDDTKIKTTHKCINL